MNKTVEHNRVKIKKLTKTQKKKIDVIAWAALFSMCERENSNVCFDDSFVWYQNALKNDANNLYIAYDEKDNEIARFILTGYADIYCLNNLIVYSPYRNKGYFKDMLELILLKHKRLLIYTSNNYLINYFYKDKRFEYNGRSFVQYDVSKEDICFKTK